jgi:hypothetical protein
MAYSKSNRYPPERASQIGHMWLIEDDPTARLLESFQNSDPIHKDKDNESNIGHIKFLNDSGIEHIVTVDGGESYPENPFNQNRHLAFIKICALSLKMEDIDRMIREVIPEPRDFNRIMQESLWYNGGVIPLSGVRNPGESVKETIRTSIDRILDYTGLYPTLQFLVSREWDPEYEMGSGRAPHFNCRACGQVIFLPRSKRRFLCRSCGYEHLLADYLQIDQSAGEENVRLETAQALRNVLEILTVISVIHSTAEKPEILQKTLFLRDGPLMLRAGLYRLVDDIRAYVRHLHGSGSRLHLVGIEKGGDMTGHIGVVRSLLPEVGDYFLPTHRYVAEEIHGRHFNARIYRNRAMFGAKVFSRVGPSHLLALNIPVCDFTRDPAPEDLIGFQVSVSTLSGLLSYQFGNALIPIVLANRFASISQRFSGSILDSFASQILS